MTRILVAAIAVLALLPVSARALTWTDIVVGGASGSGGGATALGDLTDVDTTGASENNCLIYDGSEWVPGACAEGGTIDAILNQDTLQAGATLYVSSGTVQNNFSFTDSDSTQKLTFHMTGLPRSGGNGPQVVDTRLFLHTFEHSSVSGVFDLMVSTELIPIDAGILSYGYGRFTVTPPSSAGSGSVQLTVKDTGTGSDTGLFLVQPDKISFYANSVTVATWEKDSGGVMKLYDDDASNFVGLRSSAVVASDVTWVLPAADGSAGQYLKTDGGGNLSFDTPSVSGSGDNLGNHIATMTITAGYGIDATTATFSSLTASQFVKTDGSKMLVSSAAIAVSEIQATGTPSDSTVLHGDGVWREPAGGEASISTFTVTVPISAASLAATVTDGFTGGVQTGETATNKVNFDYVALSSHTTNYFQFSYSLPEGWDGSTVTFQPIWTASGGTGAAVFALQALGRGDNEEIDVAYGSAVTVTDTLQNADRVHVAPESGALTIGGTATPGKYVVWRGYRDYLNGSDTLDGAVKLLEIRIRFTREELSD